MERGMSIRLDPEPVSGDLKSAIQKLIPHLGSLVEGNLFEASNALFEAHKAWRSPKASLEQLAWSLWSDATIRGLHEFFKKTPLPAHPNRVQTQDFLNKLMTACADRCETDEILLLPSHHQKPTDIALNKLVRDALPAFVEKFAPEHGQTEKLLLLTHFDTAFTFGFRQACYAAPDAFEKLHKALDTNTSELGERTKIWHDYTDFLTDQIEREPIFGQDRGGLTLKDVFVPLRCFWTERVRDKSVPARDDHEPKSKRVHRIRWLNNELRDWALSPDKNDNLRVVTGGPGSGKSSSGLILARDLARSGMVNIYLIRLQRLDISQSIQDIVEQFTQGRVHDPNPFEWLKYEFKPLILIFDGLDEVAPPEAGSAEATRTFLSQLREELRRRNERALSIKAIALGRPEAAERAARDMRLDPQQLLHVLPLIDLSDDHTAFVLDSDRDYYKHILTDEEFEDPEQIMAKDHRLDFWPLSRSAGNCPETPPDGLLGDELKDLTQEPLLFYLLIYSGLAGENWQKAAQNRNLIYEEIFKRVHERDLARPEGVSTSLGSGDKERRDNFFTLMECLGLAAWRNGGRSGTETDFEALREKYASPKQQDKFNNIPAANLKNVALQFFTRPSEIAPGEFGFVHKSFGEYLTARALVNAADRWAIKSQELSHAEFAKRWLSLTGEQPITGAIQGFLHAETNLRFASYNPKAAQDEAASIVSTLSNVFSHTMEHGFPAHDAVVNGTWRDREQHQRNAEESLFALIQAWAEPAFFKAASAVGPKGPIKIKWPSRTSASNFMHRLVQQRTLYGQRPLTTFQGLDLKSQNFIFADLSFYDLRGAVLHRAGLHRADLRGAVLRGAEFSQTKCKAANFAGSALHFADLSQAIDLTQEQINSANGNQHTKLPSNLNCPDHWSEDD